MMAPVSKPRIQMNMPTTFTILVLASIAALTLACGGDSEPTSVPTTPAESAATAPQATPTPEQLDDSGLVVRDLTLKAGDFGGSIEAVLFNSSETVCHAALTIAVLRQDGTVLVDFGIQGHDLDPGVEESHSGKYIGKGATDTRLVFTTCSGRYSGDSGSTTGDVSK